MTFRELEADTSRIAAGLQAMGIEPGHRIVLMVRPGLDFISLTFALFKTAATVVLIDPGMGREHLIQCLSDVKPDGFVGISLAQAARIIYRRRFPRATHNVTVGRRWFWRGPTLEHLRQHRPDEYRPPEVAAEDAAAIIFTTGSTGRPKTVARSHAFLEAQRSILTEHMGLSPDDIDLPTLPVFLLNSLSAGATCVLPDADLREVSKVDPAKVIRQIRDHGCTSTSGSPAFYEPIADALLRDGATLPSLRKLFTGGARVPAELLRKLVQVAPHARIEVVYGSTEAEPIASIEAREVLDETAAGAVVNQDNYHWIALVKHNGLLWEVDSRKAPALMDQQAFSATVERFPNTFAIVRKGHWEA